MKPLPWDALLAQFSSAAEPRIVDVFANHFSERLREESSLEGTGGVM